MNPDLAKLNPYPFQKLRALKEGINPPKDLEHIALSIGEPKHQPPEFVLTCLAENLDRISNYPATLGLPELRQSIGDWLTKRFNLAEGSIDPERHVLPVNGTREALFSFTQVAFDRTKAVSEPLVISPNPFYQIYEGAAYLAGAEPYYLNCTMENGLMPDFDEVPADVWARCQMLFLCSPGNPTGAVLPIETLKKIIHLADEHDFIIASDECYSELYFDEEHPPVGLLEACAKMGRHDFSRCVVFHSLSKRSNLPGLRSGFIAGDADILQPYFLYRTYHGCAMPVSSQLASIAAWNDEGHVKTNRDLYREKFDRVLNILGDTLTVTRPDASFYLWPEIDGTDTDFAKGLFAQQNVTVLPGSFIARESQGLNPGSKHVRMALVATVEECVEAAKRIRDFVSQ